MFTKGGLQHIMFSNRAYKNNTDNAEIDFSKSLTVSSCGIYQVFSGPTVLTERPEGRTDWQLLYVEAGEITLKLGDTPQTVKKGSIILYPPHQPQYYYYHKEHKPIIYWVHFSGRDVVDTLHHYNITTNQNVFYVGVNLVLSTLFRQIINELQLRNVKYEEMTVLKLNEIFLQINRSFNNTTAKVTDSSDLVKAAKVYFSENYNQEINIASYANSLNMTPCWFIQKFKQYTGFTPTQYILSVRLTTAQNLLKNTKYNISETAEAVGYTNTFYFSRLFQKHFGICPSKYKKQMEENNKN